MPYLFPWPGPRLVYTFFSTKHIYPYFAYANQTTTMNHENSPWEFPNVLSANLLKVESLESAYWSHTVARVKVGMRLYLWQRFICVHICIPMGLDGLQNIQDHIYLISKGCPNSLLPNHTFIFTDVGMQGFSDALSANQRFIYVHICMLMGLDRLQNKQNHLY